MLPPDIQFPMYQHAMRVISDIFQAPAYPGITLITTNLLHQYVVGMYVRAIIPPEYGFQLLNNKIVQIIEITDGRGFIVAFDSPNMEFNQNASTTEFAQVVPVGEIAMQLDAPFQNVLPYP